MALTALFCALAIGGQAQDRNLLIIEARAYNVEDNNFKLEGPSLKVSKPPKEYPNLKIASVIGIDGEKLRGKAGLVMVSKPILKATAGKASQWILNLFGNDEKPEKSTFTLMPNWRSDNGLDLGLTVAMDRKDTPKETWTYSEAPVLKIDQYFALMVTSPTRKILYTFKIQPR